MRVEEEALAKEYRQLLEVKRQGNEFFPQRLHKECSPANTLTSARKTEFRLRTSSH